MFFVKMNWCINQNKRFCFYSEEEKKCHRTFLLRNLTFERSWKILIHRYDIGMNDLVKKRREINNRTNQMEVSLIWFGACVCVYKQWRIIFNCYCCCCCSKMILLFHHFLHETWFLIVFNLNISWNIQNLLWLIKTIVQNRHIHVDVRHFKPIL